MDTRSFSSYASGIANAKEKINKLISALDTLKTLPEEDVVRIMKDTEGILQQAATTMKGISENIDKRIAAELAYKNYNVGDIVKYKDSFYAIRAVKDNQTFDLDQRKDSDSWYTAISYDIQRAFIYPLDFGFTSVTLPTYNSAYMLQIEETGLCLLLVRLFGDSKYSVLCGPVNGTHAVLNPSISYADELQKIITGFLLKPVDAYAVLSEYLK